MFRSSSRFLLAACFTILEGCSKAPNGPTADLAGADDYSLRRNAPVEVRVPTQASDRAGCTFMSSGCRELPGRSGVFATEAAILRGQTSSPTHGRPHGRSRQQPSAQVDSGVFTLLSSGANPRLVDDLAKVLGQQGLTVQQVTTGGPLQTLRGVLDREVDMGIIPLNALALVQDHPADHPEQRVRYIARLYNEELHVLAARDITDIHQLDGKSVNVGEPGSITELTAQAVFDKLGIKPKTTTYGQWEAHRLLRSGEIQAALYVAARPAPAISDFASDGRFHLVSIPYEVEIGDSYFPGELQASDYPNLIEPGQRVQTIAVGNVLAVFDWPKNSDRYMRLRRFVSAFYSRFDDLLQPGYDSRWKEVWPAATVPGWQRFPPAADWLGRRARPQPPQAVPRKPGADGVSLDR